MRPDVVTFWHGPLDALRLTCLRSQVAAGHKVTVYSFEPIAQLPDGVGNAEAEAILPHAFSEKLRPPQQDGRWRDWTILQFSDFFRMRLMARGAGLWRAQPFGKGVRQDRLRFGIADAIGQARQWIETVDGHLVAGGDLRPQAGQPQPVERTVPESDDLRPHPRRLR